MNTSDTWASHISGMPHMIVKEYNPVPTTTPYPVAEKIKDIAGGVSVAGIIYLLPTISALIEGVIK